MAKITRIVMPYQTEVKANVSFALKRIMDIAHPTASRDATPKAYVDNAYTAFVTKVKNKLLTWNSASDYILVNDDSASFYQNTLLVFRNGQKLEMGAASDFTLTNIDPGTWSITIHNVVASSNEVISAQFISY